LSGNKEQLPHLEAAAVRREAEQQLEIIDKFVRWLKQLVAAAVRREADQQLEIIDKFVR
jgi:hypothetical protein